MPTRWISVVLISIVFYSMSSPMVVLAAEQYGRLQKLFRGPAQSYYLGNPKRIEVVQTTPAASTENRTQSPSAQAQASPQAYPYGFFGAQYRPYSMSHANYYDTMHQWSFVRGY